MKQYPVATDLCSHLSIFSVGYRHTVADSDVERLAQLLEGTGWRPHHLSSKEPPMAPRHKVLSEERILTESTRSVCFPDYQKSADEDCLSIRSLLNSALGIGDNTTNFVGGRALRQNFALSLEDQQGEAWIGVPLSLLRPAKPSIEFRVDWVDLWVFNDQTAVLSFKVTLEDQPSGLELDHLTALNQMLRGPWAQVSREGGVEKNWRSDIIEGLWLRSGISNSSTNAVTVLGQLAGEDDGIEARRDKHSRYAKTLTMAEIPAFGSLANGEDRDMVGPRCKEEVEYLWNAPVTDPPFDFTPHFNDTREAKRMDIFSAYHFATMEGYPTMGDYLLYDLASCGGVGAAAGFGDDPGWQVSPEYLRTLLDESGIEIWEYWRGFALHDTLAFLVTDPSMPMSANKSGGSQAETLYYYVYVYLYHIQFKLNLLSREIIDGDLIDLYKFRVIQNRFHQFRNQYWFRDLTVDFQGVHIADKMKLGLRLDDSFATVQSEVSEVADFITDKLDKGKQALVGTLIASAYPLFYLTELLGVQKFIQSYSETHPWETGGALSLLAITAGFIGIKYAPDINMAMFRVYNRVYNRGRS